MKRHFYFLILILPLLSSCTVLQKADEGLFALTEAVTEKDRITGARMLSHDRSTQIKKGNSNSEELIEQLKQNGGINSSVDSIQYKRVKRIFTKIHAVSHLRHEKWTPILMNSPAHRLNAFVQGGTYMFVDVTTTKFLNDDQLAALIGHEIAHVTANHMGERFHNETLAAIGKSNSAKRIGFLNSFNQTAEQEADRVGLLYSVLAGYDPTGGASLWNKFNKNRRGSADYFSTHPSHSARSRDLTKLAKQYSKYSMKGQINPNHANILKTVYGNHSSEKVKAGKGGGALAFLGAALQGVAKHYEAKSKEITQIQQNRQALQKQTGLSTKIEKINNQSFKIHFSNLSGRIINNIQFVAQLHHQGGRATFPVYARGNFQPNYSYYVTFSNPQLANVYWDQRSILLGVKQLN